ncbi:MAG: DUF1837 domain-containing protein [Planctomycetes bacterium]|nr:DUF1837 domain-containing protein [Planctomycetota bacterium]
MRPALFKLIEEAIVYRYDLPHSDKGINSTIFSTENDKCYSSQDMDDIVKIIYNSVVEYSFNEFEITERKYSNLHAEAFLTRIRYEESDLDKIKLKYGFFGEVLLYAALVVLFQSKPLISKGYFYDPLEKSEIKGYDSYHLVENNKNLELWFGEVKFHQLHTNAIRSALKEIKKSLSDTYLNRNLLALTRHKNNFNIRDSKIEQVIEEWRQNPTITILEQIKKHHMKLVYPVMLAYESKSDDYDSEIKKIPEYIAKNYTSEKFDLSIEHSIFFVLLPLKRVKEIKKEVLKWITSKKPLMS